MKNEEICCPEFEPELWEDKVVEWDNKKFITCSVKTFMYMPIGFGKAMTKLTGLIDSAGAEFVDAMCLSNNTSKWNMNIYLAVDKEISGVENITLSGKFFCKVFEGPFNETGKWMSEFTKFLKSKGIENKEIYMWYTTCPKCAKKYGKNYVVIVARI